MNYIFHNFWYKLAALVLAVIIWGIIQGEQVLEINRDIVVTLQTPEGFAVRGETTRIMAATIKGPRVLVMESPKTFSAEIALPPLKGKQFRVRINPEQVKGVNQRLTFTIHDPYFYVYVDEETSKLVPVRHAPHGTPPSGFAIKRVLIQPSHVKISGLKGDLQKIREVMTTPIDISELREDTIFERAILLPPEILSANISESLVKVSMQVANTFITKKLSAIPIEIFGENRDIVLIPDVASVLLQGTAQNLRFVRSSEIKAFIELEPGVELPQDIEIKVNVPSETMLLETMPSKVRVVPSSESKSKPKGKPK